MKDIFSERFRAARKQSGLTLDDIAEVCQNRAGDVPSRAAIAQWEKPGGTKPSFENLIAATRKIGVSLDYLTGLSDNPATGFMVAEKPGEYNPLSAEARHLAHQWERLSPSSKKAIRNLLNSLTGVTQRK